MNTRRNWPNLKQKKEWLKKHWISNPLHADKIRFRCSLHFWCVFFPAVTLRNILIIPSFIATKCYLQPIDQKHCTLIDTLFGWKREKNDDTLQFFRLPNLNARLNLMLCATNTHNRQRANIDIFGPLKRTFYHENGIQMLQRHYLLAWFMRLCNVIAARLLFASRMRMCKCWMLDWDHTDISLSTGCGGHVIIECIFANSIIHFRLHRMRYWNGATCYRTKKMERKEKQNETCRKELQERCPSSASLKNNLTNIKSSTFIATTFSSDRSVNAIAVASLDCFWPKMNRSKVEPSKSNQIQWKTIRPSVCVFVSAFVGSFFHQIEVSRCTRTQLNCCNTHERKKQRSKRSRIHNKNEYSSATTTGQPNYHTKQRCHDAVLACILNDNHSISIARCTLLNR